MQDDFIIVLAWPEGLTAAAGSWYDKILASNGKYRVGHSALVLVNSKTKELQYFDFGRYHTPLGFGRARDSQTDPDLNLHTKAIISENRIINIKEILFEIKHIKSTHGKGKMYASLLREVCFQKGYKYAKKVQEKGIVPYGPFVINGTNCSRYVASIMIASKPGILTRLRLKYPFCISPSPKRNISIANKNYYIVENKKQQLIKKSFLKSYFSSIEQ